MNRRDARWLYTPLALIIISATVLMFLGFATSSVLRIDLGTNDDDRFVAGFFAPEVSSDGVPFRWSNPGSRLLLHGTNTGPTALRFRINGELREQIDDRTVRLERDQQTVTSWDVASGWRVYHVLLPEKNDGNLWGLTADPLGLIANAHFFELRNLGVPIDWIEIESAPLAFTSVLPPLVHALALAVGLIAIATLARWADHMLWHKSRLVWRSVRVDAVTAIAALLLVVWVQRDPFTLVWALPVPRVLLGSVGALGVGALLAWMFARQAPAPVASDGPLRTGRSMYGGIFMVALATLLYQILLSRIFSVTMFYHFAFVAISIAMFGMTVGAGLVYAFPRWFPTAHTPRHLALSALGFAVTIVLSFLTHLSVPFSLDRSTVQSLIGLYAVVFTYIVISLPFVFSGVCVTLALTRFPLQVSRLYAADLAGAALGCLLVVIALNMTDGPTAVVSAAVLAGLGAVFFAASLNRRRLLYAALLCTGLLGGLTMYNTIRLYDGQTSLLRLVWVRGEREDTPLYETWNHFSRVKVYGNPESRELPFSWGLSPNFPDSRMYRQVYLQIDSEAGAALAGYHGDLSDVDYLRHDVTNVAHYLRSAADVLVVGVGGGRDILSALAFDQQSVTGIEINEDIIDAVNEEFGDLTGYLYRDPRVTFVADEARSYIVRQDDSYDIIQISLIDTWAATTAGAYTFTENSLYTTEAWQIFLDRLTPDGLLTVSRWYFPDRPGEVYRLTTLATDALLQSGVTNPREHIMIVRVLRDQGGGPEGVGTILVSKEPFSATDIAMIENVSVQMGFDVVLSPRFALDETFAAIASGQNLDEIVAQFPINIAPPTDDSPFFFHMLRLQDILNPNLQSQGTVSYNMQAVAILGILLAIVTSLTFLFIILPLMLTTKRGALRGSSPLFIYFASIGLGFMLIEISQMQRLIIFLGHPTYGLAVVLFTLLLASGVGSYSTQALAHTQAMERGRLRLGMLLGALIVFGVLTPLVIPMFQSATTFLRILVAVGILFPLGFFMGMAFPIGMQVAARHSAALTPWLWGVNGAMSVCASVLAVFIALNSSISTTFWLGFVCYVLTFVSYVWMTRRSLEPTTVQQPAPAGQTPADLI